MADYLGHLIPAPLDYSDFYPTPPTILKKKSRSENFAI